MGRKENTMATTDKKPATDLVEDPAALVGENSKAPEPGTVKEDPKPKKMDEKDRQIAEMQARLAEAEKLIASMTKGDDYKIVHELSEKCAKEGKDPWQVDVDIRVPARRDSNDPYYWLNINGRSAQIPANNTVQTMRLPFACTIVDMIRMEQHAKNFADEEIQVKDPLYNPHEVEDIRK